MRKHFFSFLVVIISLAACSVNPVTGERNFQIYDTDWERQVGTQMYAPMKQSQGGEFILDPDLTAYVNDVGNRLASQARRQLIPFFRALGLPVSLEELGLAEASLKNLNTVCDFAVLPGSDLHHLPFPVNANDLLTAMVSTTASALGTEAAPSPCAEASLCPEISP